MAMEDESPLQLSRWSLQLQRGEELTLPPGDDEPFVVTEVFLVDPESAAGQGVVSAYVEMGTLKIMLAQLSSEVKAVELESPLVLEEDFRLYVSKADTDIDEDDAVVVQFKGFMVSLPLYDSDESEDEEEGDEEVATSEDEEDEESDCEEDEEDEEGDGEVDGDVAKAKASSNA